MQRKTEIKQLTENFVAIALTQIISYVIPLISLPYLARVLGAEKFGLVYWAQSLITYFCIITDFGFGLSAVKEISIHRNDHDKINQIFSSILFVKLCLIFICFIILTVLIIFIPKFNNEMLLFYLTFFMVIGNAIYPMWFFQGIEHMKYITFLNILSKSIFLGLIFIFIHSPKDYNIVAFLNSMGFFVSGLIGICIACRKFKLKIIIPSKENVLYQFKYSSEFFMSRIAVAGFTNTNAFVLGLIANPISVAYYTAAEKIYNSMLSLSYPITQTLYPYISKFKDIRRYKKIFYPSIIFLICMCIFMFFCSKIFIQIFYGLELLPAYKILRFFCFTVFFTFVSSLVGYPLLAAMGYSKATNFSIVLGSIVHIIGLSILYAINHLNIYTIAFMTVVAAFVSMFYKIHAISKYSLWNEE